MRTHESRAVEPPRAQPSRGGTDGEAGGADEASAGLRTAGSGGSQGAATQLRRSGEGAARVDSAGIGRAETRLTAKKRTRGTRGEPAKRQRKDEKSERDRAGQDRTKAEPDAPSKEKAKVMGTAY